MICGADAVTRRAAQSRAGKRTGVRCRSRRAAAGLAAALRSWRRSSPPACPRRAGPHPGPSPSSTSSEGPDGQVRPTRSSPAERRQGSRRPSGRRRGRPDGAAKKEQAEEDAHDAAALIAASEALAQAQADLVSRPRRPSRPPAPSWPRPQAADAAAQVELERRDARRAARHPRPGRRRDPHRVSAETRPRSAGPLGLPGQRHDGRVGARARRRRRRTSSPTGWPSCRASAAPATRSSPSSSEDRADLIYAQATSARPGAARSRPGRGRRDRCWPPSTAKSEVATGRRAAGEHRRGRPRRPRSRLPSRPRSRTSASTR